MFSASLANFILVKTNFTYNANQQRGGGPILSLYINEMVQSVMRLHLLPSYSLGTAMSDRDCPRYKVPRKGILMADKGNNIA